MGHIYHSLTDHSFVSSNNADRTEPRESDLIPVFRDIENLSSEIPLQTTSFEFDLQDILDLLDDPPSSSHCSNYNTLMIPQVENTANFKLSTECGSTVSNDVNVVDFASSFWTNETTHEQQYSREQTFTQEAQYRAPPGNFDGFRQILPIPLNASDLTETAVEKTPLVDERFHCTVCARSFKTKQGWAQHDKYRHPQEELQCRTCKKLFKTKSALKSHEYRHIAATRQLKCPDCPKRFKLSYDLGRHRSVHNGQYPYCCPLCGVGKTRSDHLVRHLQSHAKVNNRLKVPPSK